MKYCPQCAAQLTERDIAGRRRRACPDDACGYVHWDNPLPVEYVDTPRLAPA